MIRSDLIRIIAEENPHLPRAKVEAVVVTFFREITEALARGERVALRGFAGFSRKTYGIRMRRNPKTGEKFIAGPVAAPKFKASQRLLNRINAIPDPRKNVMLVVAAHQAQKDPA